MNPDPDLAIILMSVLAALIGFPIARGISRWLERKGNAPPTATLTAGIEDRLQRIEQAVDAIAVEMERVSEGQRFTTRLLSERTAADAGSHAVGAGGPRADDTQTRR